MKEEKPEPAIPYLIKAFKTRKMKKKLREIEYLKLDIEKTKLYKQLYDLRKELKE